LLEFPFDDDAIYPHKQFSLQWLLELF